MGKIGAVLEEESLLLNGSQWGQHIPRRLLPAVVFDVEMESMLSVRSAHRLLVASLRALIERAAVNGFSLLIYPLDGHGFQNPSLLLDASGLLPGGSAIAAVSEEDEGSTVFLLAWPVLKRTEWRRDGDARIARSHNRR
ncbi:hypothetical protein ACLOJK_037289 [Asimina triloba]